MNNLDEQTGFIELTEILMLLTVCIKFEFVSKRQIQFPAYLKIKNANNQ